MPRMTLELKEVPPSGQPVTYGCGDDPFRMHYFCDRDPEYFNIVVEPGAYLYELIGEAQKRPDHTYYVNIYLPAINTILVQARVKQFKDLSYDATLLHCVIEDGS